MLLDRPGCWASGTSWRALPFHLQDLNEVGVVDLTDWQFGIDVREERWREPSQEPR